MINTLLKRLPILLLFIVFAFISIYGGCKKESNIPEPQLVPIYSMFRLFKVNQNDTLRAGWGYLDQTVTNNVKITIKLNADFRKQNGQYNINLYKITGATTSEYTSNVGTMPANMESWQSDIIKPTGSSQPYTFDQLHIKDTYFIKITSGNEEVAMGELEWAWE
ncbi:MAG: hypothetical protein QM763_24655 [Agriterribacter sp.]